MQHSLHPLLLEAGCDEAGRGCLAGPVVAAAVILPPDFFHPLLNDSKQLTEKQRDQLRKVVEEEAVAWAVAGLSPEEIDRINILKASIAAMHKALHQLAVRPQHILVDGNRFYPYGDVPHTCMVKGDARFANIAAASVLAKTHRDEVMTALHEKWPQYAWKVNKGYPTVAHRAAIQEHGVSLHHRRSFRLLPENSQLSLEF
jgi:ribonuclease HII